MANQCLFVIIQHMNACNKIHCNNQVIILQIMDYRTLLSFVLDINCWFYANGADTAIISICTGNPLFVITLGSPYYTTANISFSKFVISTVHAFCVTVPGVSRENTHLLMITSIAHGVHSFTANQISLCLALDNRGSLQIPHTGELIDRVSSYVLSLREHHFIPILHR